MSLKSVNTLIFVVVALCALRAGAQMMPNPYGPSVSLEDAKKAAAGVLAEAHKNSWNMAVAVGDPRGNLGYFEKMDATQLGSAHLAIYKARSAARVQRPTQAVPD